MSRQLLESQFGHNYTAENGLGFPDHAKCVDMLECQIQLHRFLHDSFQVQSNKKVTKRARASKKGDIGKEESKTRKNKKICCIQT